MYPWISRTLDFGLQFWGKKCGLYIDVYGTNLRERNFKGEANNKQLDSEDTERSDFIS